MIELWARYNLRALDSLHVIDHGSEDNTVVILQQLQAEGLPIVLHHWTDPAHTQAEAMRTVARPLAAGHEVDFVVPLDADELLDIDYAGLREALRALPPGHVGAMRWRTFLPEGDEADPYFFRRMRHYRSLELNALSKVIAPAYLLAEHTWQVGCHALYNELENQVMPAVELPFVLAHYPIRSEVQLRRKVMLGSHASRLKRVRFRGESWHWLHIETQLARDDARGRPVDLLAVGLGYSYSWDPHVKAAQQVLPGQIKEAREVVQRYEVRLLGLKEIRQALATSSAQHAEQLALLGRAEFNDGNRAWREQRFDEALGHYGESALLNPALTVAHLGRARCLVKIGRWMLAREAFFDALRIDPNNYSAWLESGHLCRQMGEFEQAVGAYQRAIEVAPERYEALLGMARVLEQMGRSAQGAAAYESAQRAALTNAPDDTARKRLREVNELMARYRLELDAARSAELAHPAGLVTDVRPKGR